MGALRWAVASVAAVPVVLVVAVTALTATTPGCPGAGAASVSGGSWRATAYGPPWTDGNGSGITATGLNLTAAPALYEVAVDPAVVALRSYVHVTPNPFGTSSAFYAGDTGRLVSGRHIDIYDWRGRTDQLAWGTRAVTVTPAPTPGAANLLGHIIPSTPAAPAAGPPLSCPAATVGLTGGVTARIQADGSALAPAFAPAAVKRAIAAANEIHTSPYPSPDVHYGTLSQLWPAYDCSGATSFVLFAAGLLSATAETSTGLETYGLPGAGRWVTLYANSAHVWIVLAGIAFDTANYGGAPVPAGSGPRWRADPAANLQDGTPYVVRHPPGL